MERATAGDRPARTGAPSKEMATQRPHPPYKLMVIEALQNGDQRSGTSLQGICSFILDNYPTARTPAFRFQVRSAIARGLTSGDIKRSRKTQDVRGIQGRFLLDKSKMISDKPKPRKRTRSQSSSPERSRKVTKKTTVKAVSKVAKPRSRSASPVKGKAKIKVKSAAKGETKAKKSAASKNKSPKKAATKKPTPKKAAGEKGASKKATSQKTTADKKNTASKKKAAPKTTTKKPKA